MAMPALACVVAGCSQSGDPDVWYNKTILENLGGRTPAPDTPAGAASTQPGGGPVPGAPLGMVPVSELYQSPSSCGALLPGASAPAAAAPLPTAAGATIPSGDIALQMTECDIVRRAGPPDRIELAAAPNGERILTLSYLRGPYPRIYHFTFGRLVGIENLPPPLPPPVRRVPGKSRQS